MIPRTGFGKETGLPYVCSIRRSDSFVGWRPAPLRISRASCGSISIPLPPRVLERGAEHLRWRVDRFVLLKSVPLCPILLCGDSALSRNFPTFPRRPRSQLRCLYLEKNLISVIKGLEGLDHLVQVHLLGG